jgi:hypothetical protein
MGKYAFVPGGSEEFAREKQAEIERDAEQMPATGQPKQLRGLGVFKGKLGGTEALFQQKKEEIQREERRS